MELPRPAFYTPLLWPIVNLNLMINKEAPPKKVELKRAEGTMDQVGNLTAFAAALRSFLLAYLCVFVFYGENQYPAFGRAASIEWDWIWPILVRNAIGTVLICGLWDYILLLSPLKDKLTPYKMSAEYPSTEQLRHDAFWTMIGSQFAGWIEVLLCYLWASGTLPYQRNMRASPLSNFLWAITITHWRIPHFWLVHRMMHPWKFDAIPDVGKFLYKHVHSLHHKSYNTSAFSGTSMHPVEVVLYYSACVICLPFGCHPCIALACIVDCAIGAWLGHDGFQWPGSGDYFHFLHHHHFDCNYGAPHVPMDKWVGTYIGDKTELKKIWGKRKSKSVGRSVNEKMVPLHPMGAMHSEMKKGE